MGRYRLTEQLTVSIPNCVRYRATDRILNRQADVYFVWGDQVQDAVDAARRAALVDDPRLVRVIDAGTYAGTSFILTAPVDGVSLADLGPLPAVQARAIAGEVASALQVAATRDVYHQVLSPEAIALGEGRSVFVMGLGWEAAMRGVPVQDAQQAGQNDAEGLIGILYSALTARWPGKTPSRVPGPPLWDGTAVAPIELVSGVPGDLNTLCSVVLSGRGLGPQDAAQVVSDLGVWSAINLTLPRGMGPSPTLGPLSLVDTEPIGSGGLGLAASSQVAPASQTSPGAASQPEADATALAAQAPLVADQTYVPPLEPEVAAFPVAPPLSAEEAAAEPDPWAALPVDESPQQFQTAQDQAELTSDLARIEALLAESRALAAEVEAEFHDDQGASTASSAQFAPTLPPQSADLAMAMPSDQPTEIHPPLDSSNWLIDALGTGMPEPAAAEATAPPIDYAAPMLPGEAAVQDWDQVDLGPPDQPTDIIEPVTSAAMVTPLPDIAAPETAEPVPGLAQPDFSEPAPGLAPPEYPEPAPISAAPDLSPVSQFDAVAAEPVIAQELASTPGWQNPDPTEQAGLAEAEPANEPVAMALASPAPPEQTALVADQVAEPPPESGSQTATVGQAADPAATPDQEPAPDGADQDQAPQDGSQSDQELGSFDSVLQGPSPKAPKAPRRWRTVVIFTVVVVVALVLGLLILKQTGVIHFGLAPLAPAQTVMTLIPTPVIGV